eukprot:1533321-Amphidinium_carterae.1
MDWYDQLEECLKGLRTSDIAMVRLRGHVGALFRSAWSLCMQWTRAELTIHWPRRFFPYKAHEKLSEGNAAHFVPRADRCPCMVLHSMSTPRLLQSGMRSLQSVAMIGCGRVNTPPSLGFPRSVLELPETICAHYFTYGAL